MASDHQRYHNTSIKRLFARQYTEGRGSKNNIILRIAWSASMWDMRRILIAKTLADAFNRHFERDPDKGYHPVLKKKMSGYPEELV